MFITKSAGLMGRGFMRFAKKRCRSGSKARSFLPTMYQLGFDFHAVPSFRRPDVRDAFFLEHPL
jgi:hypothetical protein